ncbi:MAG: ABC transporter substrate-binding protein [Flavobacteriaceae bacterium]|nr:ABC transporter substrate-binding protein [Flavobacteriaceae bacterium]
MNKSVVQTIIFVFAFLSVGYCQDYSALWQGHFSYNNIVDITRGEEKIFAAAENAVFEYDIFSQEVKTITTIEGLSGGQITTIYYSETYQDLIIGYETGLIEIYSETDQSVLSVVDILEKQNITPANKGINDFYEHEGLLYISTDYGVSIYNLENLEFGDTYFLGNGGAQIQVNQVAILNNEIFVACYDNNGLRKAELSNPNLIDFQQWQTFMSGNFRTVNTFNNFIYAVRANRDLFEITNTNFTQLFALDVLPLDSQVSSTGLIFSSANKVDFYNENIQLVNSLTPNEDYDTSFTSAIAINDIVFVGTSDFGVLRTSLSDGSLYTSIKPSGPSENNIFKIDATTNTVWATYGAYNEALNPYPLNSKGISYLRDDLWENIPFDNVLGTRELNTITPNIFNPNQVFISSFFNGILVLEDFQPTIQLNQTNSGLESLDNGNPNNIDIRISATEFDTEGRLWVLNSRVDEALKRYDPITGNWQGYSFSDIIDNPMQDETGFFDLAIGNDGTKWIGSYSNGLLAYNEGISSSPLRNINSEVQNVPPFSRFQALALDNRNQLWVGMTKGLRVLYNTSGFFDDPNPSLSQIIILEDGIAKELLEGQSITDIEVDGSNNKWVGTADGGVFYFSPDGQETIYQFTTDNSPLPSNTINDISLDTDNGIVYIATTRGLLSFSSGGSKPEETLDNAFAYPNPVRPEYDVLGYNDLNDITKGVKISGLTENVNIKITDIEGNLVAEAQTNINLRSSSANYNFAIDGGTAIWNGKNLGNSIVRTGVYLILISDLDSFETKVLKVLIVR